MHGISKANRFTANDFVTKNNNTIQKNTFFPHKNTYKETWQSPDG